MSKKRKIMNSGNGQGNGCASGGLHPGSPAAQTKLRSAEPVLRELPQAVVDEPVFESPAAATPIKLSVVIPMFNEEENLRQTVDSVAQTLAEFRDGPWEIVIVNDGSRDCTWDVARELAARSHYAPWLRVEGYRRNRGRGFALRTGFRAARGEWIVSTDADLSYDPQYILDLIDVLRDEDDVDMVIASAYMPGGGVVGVPFKRLLVSRLGNLLLSWFMSSGRTKVYTITCVFRAYRRYVLENLEIESDGKDIHLEILSKALMLGYKFKEVPVILRSRKLGQSKHQFGTTATSHLIFALFERPILVFGLIGLFLLLASFLGMGYVTYLWHHRILNPERPLLIIILLAFLGGIQLLSFGVIGTQFVNLRKEIIKLQARVKSLTLHRHSSK